MVSLEKFVKKITGSEPSQIGTLGEEMFDPELLIATRPFLIGEKFKGKKKRRGSLRPEVIVVDQFWRFIIDGHHKARKEYDELNRAIRCVTLNTTDPRIKKVLFKRAWDLDRLEIR